MSDLFSTFEVKVCKGECTWQEILSEINAIKNENTIVDYMLFIRLEQDVDGFSNQTFNPYQLYTRKQMFQQLSKDARKMAKVIVLCMNGHRKFSYLESELIYKDKVAKKRIYHVMKKHFHWTVRRVKKAFSELSDYCNELSRME